MKNLTDFFSINYQSALMLGGICMAGMGVLQGCEQPSNQGYLEGETMGTSYHIKFQNPNDVDISHIKQRIDERLTAINNSMSTYQDDSTITKFNKLGANQTIKLDTDFMNVLTDAKEIYELSGGAFDPTVMPLVNLWGFGSITTVDRLQSPPTNKEINNAKALIGFDKVKLSEQNLSKTLDEVAIDFSAIAKGYAVDAIAEVLHEQFKINNYMVEIGGEVATLGVNPQSQPWQIAIDTPVIDNNVKERQVIAVIQQPKGKRLHLATSGNYRNSAVYNGVRYSHTIDPISGQPIVGGAPSVSVADDSVSRADAWATALTAMTYKKALDTAIKNNIAALFIIPKSGNLKTIADDSKFNNINPLDYWQVVETPAMLKLRANTIQ